MARTPKSLASAQLASAALTTIYTAPAGFNAPIAVLAFTNTTDTVIVIDVYHDTLLQRTITLPAGSGREVIYIGFNRRVINAGEAVKIQADSTAAFNYSLSGSEVSV